MQNKWKIKIGAKSLRWDQTRLNLQFQYFFDGRMIKRLIDCISHVANRNKWFIKTENEKKIETINHSIIFFLHCINWLWMWFFVHFFQIVAHSCGTTILWAAKNNIKTKHLRFSIFVFTSMGATTSISNYRLTLMRTTIFVHHSFLYVCVFVCFLRKYISCMFVLCCVCVMCLCDCFLIWLSWVENGIFCYVFECV